MFRSIYGAQLMFQTRRTLPWQSISVQRRQPGGWGRRKEVRKLSEN
uniref:Uncharacterized protein n=1 Tax=Rhizophora mucronata TaxID=61149 RepID=A0A2P2R378_RHIMU